MSKIDWDLELEYMIKENREWMITGYKIYVSDRLKELGDDEFEVSDFMSLQDFAFADEMSEYRYQGLLVQMRCSELFGINKIDDIGVQYPKVKLDLRISK